MKLIDADKLMESLDPKESVWVGLVLSELINNAPTVDAIPKEWIKKQLKEEKYRRLLIDHVEWHNCLSWLLEEWEEENENRVE